MDCTLPHLYATLDKSLCQWNQCKCKWVQLTSTTSFWARSSLSLFSPKHISWQPHGFHWYNVFILLNYQDAIHSSEISLEFYGFMGQGCVLFCNSSNPDITPTNSSDLHSYQMSKIVRTAVKCSPCSDACNVEPPWDLARLCLDTVAALQHIGHIPNHTLLYWTHLELMTEI